MAGAGIFINIVLLTQRLQLYGGLLYLLVGLLTLPLIFVFAHLAEKFPVGGFYAFSRPLSPFFAFISCWAYFFGKLASVALYLHVVAKVILRLMPNLCPALSPLIVGLTVLAIYMYLNCQNLKTGVLIQNFFAASKTIPMILLICLGMYHFDINIFNEFPLSEPYINFIMILPSVLACFAGFEAACSVSRNIENAQVNAPKAIFYSFFSIIAIYITFQTLTGMMLIPNIANIADYSAGYEYLMHLVPADPWIQTKLITFISLLIGLSAMGGAYGILFSNAWNLYTLAQHQHTFMPAKITTLNKHHAPQAAVLVEGAICALFLVATSGSPIILQQISTMAGGVMYALSCITFLYLYPRSIVGLLAVINSVSFVVFCIFSSYSNNLLSLYLFGSMLLLGMLMYRATLKK